MPSASPSPSSPPVTYAQQVARWMRQATSPKQAPRFLEALERGEINVNMRDRRSATLLHHLAMEGGQTVFEAVMQRLPDDPEQRRALVDARCALDGATPLMVAAAHGRLAMVNALLAAGADPMAYSRFDGPVLQFAARGWHPEVVAALLAQGVPVDQPADSNTLNRSSVTALSKAFYQVPGTGEEQERQRLTVERLLAAGSNPNVPVCDDGTMTNLCRAIGHPVGRVQQLLAAGAVPDMDSESQQTALHQACVNDDINPQTRADAHAAVRVLLDARVDVNRINGSGDTPLHLAARRNAPALVTELTKAGASLTLRNHDGQTPMDCARDGHHGPSVHAVIALEAAELSLEMDGIAPPDAGEPSSRRRL